MEKTDRHGLRAAGEHLLCHFLRLHFVERDERLTPCGRALIDLERQTAALRLARWNRILQIRPVAPVRSDRRRGPAVTISAGAPVRSIAVLIATVEP
jgi:hypothetical protein